MNTEIFNRVFQSLAEKSGYSDSEIARRLNVNRSTVLRWKTGEQSPPLSKIPQISALFDVHPTVFVGGEVHKTYDDAQMLVKKFNALDDKGKHTVKTILEMEFNRVHKPHLEVVAAHNDNYSDEELELMKKDLEDL